MTALMIFFIEIMKGKIGKVRSLERFEKMGEEGELVKPCMKMFSNKAANFVKDLFICRLKM